MFQHLLLSYLYSMRKLKERVRNLKKLQKEEFNPYRERNINKFEEKIKELKNGQNK